MCLVGPMVCWLKCVHSMERCEKWVLAEGEERLAGVEEGCVQLGVRSVFVCEDGRFGWKVRRLLGVGVWLD